MWAVNTRQRAEIVLLHRSDLLSGCSPAAFACCNSARTLRTNRKTNGYLYFLLLDTRSEPMRDSAGTYSTCQLVWDTASKPNQAVGPLQFKGHCRINTGRQERWGIVVEGKHIQIEEMGFNGFSLLCLMMLIYDLKKKNEWVIIDLQAENASALFMVSFLVIQFGVWIKLIVTYVYSS